MQPERSNLEVRAQIDWRKWGTGYALFTRCSECGQQRPCRGKRRRYMLCLTCFDLVGPK